MRVRHFGRVGRHSADAAFNGVKHAVSAVDTTPHDKVGDHGFAAGRFTDADASARIIVAGQIFVYVRFHYFYISP